MKKRPVRNGRSEVSLQEAHDTMFCALYTVCLAGCIIGLLLLHVWFWLSAILGIILGSLLFYGLWYVFGHLLNWVTRGRYFEKERGVRLENVIPPGLIIVVLTLFLYPVFAAARHKAQVEAQKAQIRAQAQARQQIAPLPVPASPVAPQRGETHEH